MAKKLKKGACKRVGVGARCLCRMKNGKYKFAKNSRCSKARKRSKKSK